MKKTALLILLLFNLGYAQNSEILKRGILPVVKISPYTDQDGLRYKFPTGTALLVSDKNHYPDRLFLVTAKHVIEKDSVTECMINFSKSDDIEKKIVNSVKKYTIFRKEWKFHKFDHYKITEHDTSFFTYDIAIAEIFLPRIQIDGETLWHSPLELDHFTTKELKNDDSVKILAFPFVNKFNWERGLTLGDLEEDRGIQRFSSRRSIDFEKNKSVMDLNEIYIENPKFRPGYSGGLVFYINNGEFMFSGVSMGMTNVVKRAGKQFCYGFYIKAENLRDALFYNFK
jgi:hypothetical protein